MSATATASLRRLPPEYDSHVLRHSESSMLKHIWQSFARGVKHHEFQSRPSSIAVMPGSKMVQLCSARALGHICPRTRRSQFGASGTSESAF